MTGKTCSQPGCDRPHHSHGLCDAHQARAKRQSTRAGPIATAAVIVDGDVFTPCPPELLDLAGRCAENDARAILRLIWPHLLEARLAGVEPFTIEAAS